MKRLLIAASAVLALSFVGSSGAWAQHYGCNSGYGGGYNSGYGGGYSSPRLSVSVGYGNYGGYPRHSGYSGYNGYSGYGGHHGFGGHSTWHDTSHLDYHSPSLVPHGNHLDYVPGHYDVHRTGHWDRHGH
ncbi:MAG: hypothetical protein WKF77_07230 [Planctomycetaceae bacterium]